MTEILLLVIVALLAVVLFELTSVRRVLQGLYYYENMKSLAKPEDYGITTPGGDS